MRWLAVLMLATLVACSDQRSSPTASSASVRPQDFVLRPCGISPSETACALVIAGGKRVLFGTPAGIGRSLNEGDLRQLDAVILFSLRGADLEGLDEVRNVSWQLGRDTPLLVIGPVGTADTVVALNSAFEQADALRVVDEGIPPGGYDAAVLVSRELGFGREAQVGFDTGDLTIVGRVQADGRVEYTVSYEVELMLSSCGIWLPKADTGFAELQTGSSCETSDLSWPLSEQIMLFSPAVD